MTRPWGQILPTFLSSTLKLCLLLNSQTSLIIPASVPVMSSDLESTLEALRMNDYVSGMVVHTLVND